MIRCSECKKDAVPMTKYMHWLNLYNCIEFMFTEGYIEESTRDRMQDSLMTLKDFAFEEDSA